MSTYHDRKYCENMTSMVALGTVIFWTDLVDRQGFIMIQFDHR